MVVAVILVMPQKHFVYILLTYHKESSKGIWVQMGKWQRENDVLIY